jgi:hypothetical protein
MAHGAGQQQIARATGRLAAESVVVQENATLLSPAGTSLHFGRSTSRECLHRVSTSRSFSDRSAGWMGRPIPSPHLDSPTFVGKRVRCFPWQNPPRAFPLPLARLVRFVGIIAGEGLTDSVAPPGSDLRTCASLRPSSPPFLLSRNTAGTANTETREVEVVSSRLR